MVCKSIHCKLNKKTITNYKTPATMKPAQIIDLLQVDLLASGASLVWPRNGRPRATKWQIRRRTFGKSTQIRARADTEGAIESVLINGMSV